ncbi:MAG: S41 family peptidase [Coriobacteriia bacterium]|nr:S41 family peptidase [Coriobacteriia bacterium]
MKRFLQVALAAALVLTVGAGSFVGGALFERMRGTLVPTMGGSSSSAQELVGEVQGIIRADALKPNSEESMTTGAIDGLLASLEDTYAAYFDPKANKEFKMDAKGEFFGVGMSLGMRETTPTVMSVFKGTPAEKAGLKAEDEITAVDGVRKKKWELDAVVAMIRGPRGTQVTIEVFRPETAKTITFKVTRDRITIPNIMAEMVGRDVGLIRLMQFNELAADDIRAKMAELSAKGAKGFVLDLRENPGGLLSSAVAVSSLYIESGVIVRVDERGKPESEEMALGDVATDKPLVVLIDENSASASEIVAGALQDYKRATIVGSKSYGKGSVQTIRELSNGGSVKLTNAHYLTPKSRVIDGKGVMPDVVVTMEPKLQAKRETDTQLARALAVLRGKF